MSLLTTGAQYKYKHHQQPHTKVWLPSYWAIHNLLLLLTRLLMYRLYRTLLGLRDSYHLVLLCRPAKSLLFPRPQLLAYQRQSVRKGWITLVVPCRPPHYLRELIRHHSMGEKDNRRERTQHSRDCPQDRHLRPMPLRFDACRFARAYRCRP